MASSIVVCNGPNDPPGCTPTELSTTSSQISTTTSQTGIQSTSTTSNFETTATQSTETQSLTAMTFTSNEVCIATNNPVGCIGGNFSTTTNKVRETYSMAPEISSHFGMYVQLLHLH